MVAVDLMNEYAELVVVAVAYQGRLYADVQVKVKASAVTEDVVEKDKVFDPWEFQPYQAYE